MRVGTEIPAVGTVIDWDIEEILESTSIDGGGPDGDWDWLLEDKREDFHYDDVMKSLKKWGFIRPLTAYEQDGRLRFGDGHHRLAAAIEMGMTTVPVEIFADAAVAEDSGEWDLSTAGTKKKIAAISNDGEDDFWA